MCSERLKQAVRDYKQLQIWREKIIEFEKGDMVMAHGGNKSLRHIQE